MGEEFIMKNAKLLMFSQISNKTIDDFSDFFALSIGILEISFSDIFLI